MRVVKIDEIIRLNPHLFPIVSDNNGKKQLSKYDSTIDSDGRNEVLREQNSNSNVRQILNSMESFQLLVSSSQSAILLPIPKPNISRVAKDSTVGKIKEIMRRRISSYTLTQPGIGSFDVLHLYQDD